MTVANPAPVPRQPRESGPVRVSRDTCAFLAHPTKCACGHYCHEHVTSDLGYVVCLYCGCVITPSVQQQTLHYVEGYGFRRAVDTRPL